MQSREQEMAAAVYAKVAAYRDDTQKDSEQRNKYGGTAQSLPVLVRTAGLVQALAFVHSRKGEPYHHFLTDLAAVLGAPDAEALLADSRTANLAAYIYLTERTLLALKWFKRFAQSVLEVEATADVTGDDTP